jgi:hypothetical protein
MLTCAGILLALSLVIADVDATLSAPLPEEVARELDFFVGNWELEGEGARGPMKSSWSMKWAPGKHCLIVEYRREESDGVVHGNGVWAWDSASCELVYHAVYSDRGLEHIRTKLEKPGVLTGKHSGSLAGTRTDAACELRKDGPDQWTFKTTGLADAGLEELDVRFTRVALPGKAPDAAAAAPPERLSVAEVADKCPWKLATGRWQLGDSTSDAADEVVWKHIGNDQTAIGLWKNRDGSEFTELIGWRPDQKTLVSTAYGSNGSYWEITFTTVTGNMVKGDLVFRQVDGTVSRGTWQVTKKSDDEMPTVFVATDEDGRAVTIEGRFKRVK